MKRCRARRGPTQIRPPARRAQTVGEWSAGHAHAPEPAKTSLGLLLRRELEDVSGISVEQAQAPELVARPDGCRGTGTVEQEEVDV